DHRQREVQNDRDQDRGQQSDARDQHEPGESHARRRAEGVHRVQRGDGGAAAFLVAGEPAHEQGERAAHQDRRRQEKRRGEGNAHERRRRRTPVHVREGGDVAAVQQLEGVRRERADRADQGLGEGIDKQRRTGPEGAAEDEGADAEAGQEDGDERRRRVDGVAEDQAEVLEPDDLVEQRADAGGEENGEDGRASLHSRKSSIDAVRDLGRLLIVFGAILVAAGLLFTLGPKIGLGKLPGDFVYRRGNVSFYFPLMTSILLSIVLSLLLWLFRR